MADYRLRIAIGSTPSSALTVNFGAKNRAGFGGYPAGQAAGSTIGGTGASAFSNDARTHLVPAGTYNTAVSFGQSLYNLTLEDASSVNVFTIPNATFIREMTSVANGGAATANVDGASSQLIYVLGTNGGLARGDTVWCRDGHYNPTSTSVTISAAPWTGSGVVTVRSETPDTSADANGRRNRRHGFKIGGVRVTGTSYLPLVFKDVEFYRGPGTSGLDYFVKYPATTTAAWGVSYDNCRFFNESATTIGGVRVNSRYDGVTSLTGCLFKDMDEPITEAGALLSRGLTLRFCEFEGCYDDSILFTGEGQVVEYIWGHDYRALSGSHQDFIQSLGFTDGATHVGPSIHYAFCSTDFTVTTKEPQGIFYGDSTGTSRISDMDILNCGILSGHESGIYLERSLNPMIRATGVLGFPGRGLTRPRIMLENGEGGTISHCVAHETYITNTDVTTNKLVLIAHDLAAIQTAFPNWRDTNIKTIADVLEIWTPANLDVDSGGVVHPDGEVSGPLFPAVSGERVGAFNDMGPFLPDDPDWVAAHPPATEAFANGGFSVKFST